MQPLEDVEEQTGMEMSVTSTNNSLENEQKEGAIGKFLSETCGHTLGPNISQTYNNCLQLGLG